MQIFEIKVVDITDVDLSCIGVTKFGNFTVQVVDPVSDYLERLEVRNKESTSLEKKFNYNVIIAYRISFMKFMQSIFDFHLINNLLSGPDFRYAVFSRNLGFILCFLCKFCLICFQLVRPGWK